MELTLILHFDRSYVSWIKIISHLARLHSDCQRALINKLWQSRIDFITLILRGGKRGVGSIFFLLTSRLWYFANASHLATYRANSASILILAEIPYREIGGWGEWSIRRALYILLVDIANTVQFIFIVMNLVPATDFWRHMLYGMKSQRLLKVNWAESIWDRRGLPSRRNNILLIISISLVLLVGLRQRHRVSLAFHYVTVKRERNLVIQWFQFQDLVYALFHTSGLSC